MIALDTDHRCHRCQNWSSGWDRCRSKSRALARLGNLTIKNLATSHAREGLDVAALEDINRRFGALLDWWMEHKLGAYSEDHIAAVSLDFDDVPIEEIVAILNATLARAKSKPYSLRYFKVALEEGRGAYFKRQDDGPRRTGESRDALLARILARQRGQGGNQ